MKQVFLVDEDEFYSATLLGSFSDLGCLVERIRNARLARDILLHAEKIDLVVVDVMLSCADEYEDSPYTLLETENNRITGLVLLKELMSLRKDVFPSRAVIFSQASEQMLVRRIEAFSSQYKIPFFRKSEIRNSHDGSIAGRHRICKRMLTEMEGRNNGLSN